LFKAAEVEVKFELSKNVVWPALTKLVAEKKLTRLNYMVERTDTLLLTRMCLSSDVNVHYSSIWNSNWFV
jgi:hypothetical protein